jgi:3-deoxy-7-phosphoheptulonate synthase
MSVAYPEPEAARAAAERLRALPPLVTSFEVERLKALLADAGEGKRFVLWGGDCAETLADCTPDTVTRKLKILLQMAVVLVHGAKKPVVRIGRLAGQYAKPRSSLTETRVIDGRSVTLPSYFGDLINRAPFTPHDRMPDPRLMLDAYAHAAITLNFVRSLVDAGFADAHHPEYWDLGFLEHAGLSADLRSEYQTITRQIADGIEFASALGDNASGPADGGNIDFYVSHEALHLEYESAQTRTVPRRRGHYNLTTHLPWIGERTRALDGAHVEYARGLANPVGVKVGPKSSPQEVLALCARLNPANEPGKLVLIPRMGASSVNSALPPIVEAVRRAGARVVWITDPMHGNGLVTAGGIKTRRFEDILEDLQHTLGVFASLGVPLAGVHIELTGDDVTECLGGAKGLTEQDLRSSYQTACDPRLNYHQALELAFVLGRRLAQSRGTHGR